MSKFQEYLDQFQEYGIVEEIRHPIIVCSGLPGARVNEVIFFEDDTVGQVLSLNRDSVEVVTFADKPVRPGIRVARTNDKLFIPVGEELLGHVIDPLSNPLYSPIENMPATKREIDTAPAGIDRRSRISRPLHTGISIVDSMLPLGKGQRELIVGDRKTGKTSLALNIAKAMASQNNDEVVIYASIGKQKSEAKRLKEIFQNELNAKRLIIVAASSDQSPSLIDLTPYSAITLAEYFRDKGRDVLVIFDDLSAHAKFYREMALLGKRFPGRDSYPGDIFFKHARLLERGGNFKLSGNKEASISCLPLGETQDSTLTDYIISNLIGITDGHILFDIEAFNSGRRPAVDIFLSVTRVGKQTQSNISRDITRKTLKLLKVYKDTLTYQHFGAELSADVKKVLDKGEKLYKFFEQSPEIVITPSVQALFIVLIMEGILSKRKQGDVMSYRTTLLDYYKTKPEIKDKIDNMFKAESYKEYVKLMEAEMSNIFKWLGFLKA